ncbi:MAG: Glyoxalase-like domain protein [Bacteroidetes bacterium]|nr:Glyoxalase-like domain protein [Bacteroidota bacterium]
MTKDIWFNLPVKDIKRSKDFFTKIGFTFNEQFGGNPDISACLLAGDKNIVFMLFEQSAFKGFVGNEVTDTSKSSELLISISAESRAEVDELAKKVADAGGNVFSKPADNQGWMYGCAFADPDGHRWNSLFMDMSKMPKM